MGTIKNDIFEDFEAILKKILEQFKNFGTFEDSVERGYRELTDFHNINSADNIRVKIKRKQAVLGKIGFKSLPVSTKTCLIRCKAIGRTHMMIRKDNSFLLIHQKDRGIINGTSIRMLY